MGESDEPTDPVGRLLWQGRQRLRLSQRKAAESAGFSATQWRHMEAGQRPSGEPVNPTDENLEAAALAVGLDPGEVFDAAGRSYAPTPRAPVVVEPVTMEQLLDVMRQVAAQVERLADVLLDEDAG